MKINIARSPFGSIGPILKCTVLPPWARLLADLNARAVLEFR